MIVAEMTEPMIAVILCTAAALVIFVAFRSIRK